MEVQGEFALEINKLNEEDFVIKQEINKKTNDLN